MSKNSYCDCLKAEDVVPLIISSDYKERFVGEYHELKIRASKLSDMLYNYKNGTLSFTPECDLLILEEQLDYMNKYMSVLERRAEIENIDLRN